MILHSTPLPCNAPRPAAHGVSPKLWVWASLWIALCLGPGALLQAQTATTNAPSAQAGSETATNASHGLQALDAFLRHNRSGRAEFTQTTRTAQGPGAGKVSSGVFAFARPGKFRLHYLKPWDSLLLADGQALWGFDRDLNQVTRREQASTLAGTPIALIATSNDLASLAQAFALRAAPPSEGLDWVQATPHAALTAQAEQTVQTMRLGLHNKQLQVLEITDSFGQHTRIQLRNWSPLPSSETFTFVPPAGASVLQQ